MYNRELSDKFCKYWPFSMQWKIELWFRNTFGYWLCNWKSKPLCAQHIANLNSVMMIHDIQKLSIAFNRLLITTFVHYIGNDFLTNNDDLSFYSMSCQWIFSWILFFFNTHIAPTKKKYKNQISILLSIEFEVVFHTTIQLLFSHCFDLKINYTLEIHMGA